MTDKKPKLFDLRLRDAEPVFRNFSGILNEARIFSFKVIADTNVHEGVS